MNLSQAYKDAFNAHEKKKKEILNQDAYLDLQEEIEDLQSKIKSIQSKQDEICIPITKKKEELDLAYKKLIKSNGFDLDIVSPVYKKKNFVNVSRARSIIADEDAFLSLVSITQAKLKAYAKDRKDIKKALLGAIENSGDTVSGVEII